MNPLGGSAIWDFSLPVRNEFLKLGGIPKVDGPLTDEERRVMALFTRLSLADLEKAWNPVEHIQVRDATIELDPDNLKIADPSDTVLLVAFESHMQHANGLINICYPFKTIDPVIAKLDEWQD